MIELNAVTEVQIANNSITEDKMADDAISSAELKSLVTINILAVGLNLTSPVNIPVLFLPNLSQTSQCRGNFTDFIIRLIRL